MQKKRIDLSMVVAMTEDRVIGRENTLPWRLPSDMKRFREITKKAGTVVMGRNTWDSLPLKFQPLPGRHNIVLTNRRMPRKDLFESVSSVDEALAAIAVHGGHACIIGGAQVYGQFLPLAQVVYATIVHATILGDMHFPKLSPEHWRVESPGPIPSWPQGDEHRTSFITYKRIAQG